MNSIAHEPPPLIEHPQPRVAWLHRSRTEQEPPARSANDTGPTAGANSFDSARRLCLMGLSTVIQAVAAGAVYLAAYAVRFDGAILPLIGQSLSQLYRSSSSSRLLPRCWLSVSIAVRGRTAGFAEVSSQAEATTLGTLGFAAAVGFSRLGAIPGFQVPLSILLMDWAGSLIVLCGARVTGRLGWERYGRFFREARKVIVVGAGDAGATLARQVAARPDLGLEVVGFLDPEADTNGQTVAGKQVLGTPDELAAIAFANVETVFIATPDVSPSAARALKATAEAIGLEVQVVPRLDRADLRAVHASAARDRCA